MIIASKYNHCMKQSVAISGTQGEAVFCIWNFVPSQLLH